MFFIFDAMVFFEMVLKGFPAVENPRTLLDPARGVVLVAPPCF